jgi:hypothetical protein
MLSPLYGQLSPLRVPTKAAFDPTPIINAYIAAVESADGQSLEQGVKDAYSDFITGCHNDGIWSDIKAACILAGARTLNGAMVPLVGSAPTNNNFVSGDYDRETGLVGNGTTKYLDSGRNNNADPQNDQHMSVHVHTAHTGGNAGYGIYIGAGVGNTSGATNIRLGESNPQFRQRNRSSSVDIAADGSGRATGFVGMSRAASSVYDLRYSGANTNFTRTSQTPLNQNVFVFAGAASGLSNFTNARLSFYSIGESIDLALLDTRVSNLITALSAAIP